MTQPNDAIVERVAREALFGEEIARTDVVKPVNGAAPYSLVLFHGQRVAFHDGEFDNSFERDAGSSKAAAFATKINDALFELAKRSARAALEAAGSVERERGNYSVPWTPTEAQWGGLARAIMTWLDMGDKTPRALFQHLARTGEPIPQWLKDEPEMKALNHVPSKGTRCVLIYRAMLEAYRPTPPKEQFAENANSFLPSDGGGNG